MYEIIGMNGNYKRLKLIGEMPAIFDSRQSFYGKARIFEDEEGNKYLMSYSTIVSKCDKNGNIEHFGKYSQTTSRHQREFEKQFSK